MRKMVWFLALGLGLVSFTGYAAETKDAGKKAQKVTAESVVKCPKCGETFKVGEGLKGNEKAP